MIYILFIGMFASGISARVTLLSHRGGWFLEDEAHKSNGLVAFELFGTIAGAGAFVLSFFVFDWWYPLIALTVGYWLVGPIAVSRARYPLFYQAQTITTFVSLICSILILARFFEVI